MKKSEFLMAQLTIALREEAEAAARGQEVLSLEMPEDKPYQNMLREEQRRYAQTIALNHLRRVGIL